MVNMENYDEYMLLEADGELNTAERKALYDFLELHPELKKELDAYKAVHLVPTVDIVYPDKESLLKNDPTVDIVYPDKYTFLKEEQPKGKVISMGKRWMYAAAAAAMVVLFVSIYNRKGEVAVPVIAETTQPEKIETQTQMPADTPAILVAPPTEELHSNKPANPIIYTAKKQEQQERVPAQSLKKMAPVQVAASQKEQLIAQQEPVNIKIDVEKTQVHGEPEPGVEELIKEYVAQSEEKANPEKKGLLASLPLREEKVQGIADISDALGEKVEQVKAIKEKIKDSDISFKLGKRELFVVRL